MTYIIISVIMIIIGLIGIIKIKMPKYRDGAGYAAEMRFYFTFYVLLILGIIFLIFEIKEKINQSY